MARNWVSYLSTNFSSARGGERSPEAERQRDSGSPASESSSKPRKAPGATRPAGGSIGVRGGLATLIVGALVLLSGAWYVGIEGPRPNEARAQSAERTRPDPVQRTVAGNAGAAVEEAGTAVAVQQAELPVDTSETASSLGNVEYRVTPSVHRRYVRVERGDTLIHVLTRAGATQRDAYAVTASLSGVFNPRQLRPGRRLAVLFGVRDDAQGSFLGLQFDSSFDRAVAVQRQADGSFIATELRKQLTTELVRGDGNIDSSLFQAGLRRGVPAAAMIRLIHLFSFDVDFQRDIHPGDAFEIMFMRYRDRAGNIVRTGEVAFAALTLRGKEHRLYRYTTPEGRTDYFDERGRGLRKALMRTPIDGARLSSNFGRRRHPILGYTRMHAGVDFAAPRGTPIFAAGDGSVVFAGRRGGYGNYIRIRHNSQYQTAYAHMRGFARGVRRGTRVEQGQVIGYVGTTGRSTGPHLHYEVHRDGRQINPMTLQLPSQQRLQGEDLERFQTYRQDLDARYARLGETGAMQVIAERTDRDISICVEGRRLDPTDGRPCPDEAEQVDNGPASTTIATSHSD